MNTKFGIDISHPGIKKMAMPVALIATILACIVPAYFGLNSDFFKPLAERWGNGDLVPLLGYVAAINIAYNVLVSLRVKRSIFLAGLLAWTMILFGIAATATVLTFILLAYGIGAPLIRKVAIAPQHHASFSVAFGYAILIGIIQVAVYARFTSALVFLFSFAGLFCARTDISKLIDVVSGWADKPLERNFTNYLFSLPLSIGAILLVYASYPETHSDALVAHLMIPHQISVVGKWMPNFINYTFATMPKGADWLFTLHYLIGAEKAVRLFNIIATFLTASMVYQEVKSKSDSISGALLAAVFLSAPLTFWCVIVLFEDAVLSLFVTLSFCTLIKLRDTKNSLFLPLLSLALSAVIATKIQGFFAAMPIAIIGLGLVLKNGISPTSIRALALAVVPVFVIGIFPYATAYALTSNPVFPFYNKFFLSPYFSPDNFVDGRWIGKLSTDILYQMSFHTSKFMEGINGGFGFQWLVLTPGIAAAFLSVKARQFLLPCIALLATAAITLAFTQYARYLYPLFAPLAILGTAFWIRSGEERWRNMLIVLLICTAIANLFCFKSINNLYAFRLPHILSPGRRDQPAYPNERIFNTVVNATFGRESRVFYLIRPWGAGLDGTPLYNVPHINPTLYADASKVVDKETLAALLDKWHITHVMTDVGVTQGNSAIFDEQLKYVAREVAAIGTARLWIVNSQPFFLKADQPQ